ncbi:TPA: hypothetical protein JAN90_01985 [Legionella pneumophila]|nr:hypothetical protein [Legionella pneumophila]HAT8866747.1 hypothetical protein [Legionella pneumophila subsp. pneumophila]HAT8888310.1 hypothetical protein [Legionella pneumophila subsp. pneumophila]HAT8931850.1 hypothetical protein [Legionella pneumophila subsp. pneumophila]HAU0160944.1 hypothetical protein [Legionella pneumophila]
MIPISLLAAHPSSPLSAYNNIEQLVKRVDLYSGHDFYFGFNSSNHTFLDIIGGKQPLAIKHGPTLSLYQENVSGFSYSIYYIDPLKKALHPLMTISAEPGETYVVQQLLPWSFADFYLHAIGPVAESAPSSGNTSNEEQIVQNTIAQLATNNWPTDQEVQGLNHAITTLNSKNANIKISLHDMIALREKLFTKIPQTTSVDFITPYSPFHNNPRLTTEFFTEKFPDRITIRVLEDNYPRIEIIAPGLFNDNIYTAIYKKTSPKLYEQFAKLKNNSEELCKLLQKEFPDIVNDFIAQHCDEVIASQKTPTINPKL